MSDLCTLHPNKYSSIGAYILSLKVTFAVEALTGQRVLINRSRTVINTLSYKESICVKRMSLDLWLGRQDGIEGPSAKRQRSNFGVSISDPPSQIETQTRYNKRDTNLQSRGCSQLPKYTKKHAELEPPEIHWGKKSLYTWSVSDRSQGEEHISSLACIPDAPLALIGLENGDLDIIECSGGLKGVSNENTGHVVSSSYVPPGWPVVDIAAQSSNNIICASKRGTSVLDIASESITSFREHDREITHVSHGFEKFAMCGSEGFIGLLDIRVSNGYSELAVDSHSTLSGPKASRQRPAVSSIAWAGPYLLATGSRANETVKFWDIRYTRKSRVMSSQPRFNAGSQERGINSLHSNADGSVWALTRDARILHFNSMVDKPLLCLESNALRISSPYQMLGLIPDSVACHTGSRNGKFHPKYPLIASCSDNGVVLATEPSRASLALDVDATLASVLRVPYHSSYPSRVTSLCWHPYTSELVTVIANRAWEMWTYTGSKISYSKPTKISLKV